MEELIQSQVLCLMNICCFQIRAIIITRKKDDRSRRQGVGAERDQGEEPSCCARGVDNVHAIRPMLPVSTCKLCESRYAHDPVCIPDAWNFLLAPEWEDAFQTRACIPFLVPPERHSSKIPTRKLHSKRSLKVLYIVPHIFCIDCFL